MPLNSFRFPFSSVASPSFCMVYICKYLYYESSATVAESPKDSLGHLEFFSYFCSRYSNLIH